MRSSQRGRPVSWGMIALVLFLGALTALISAYVEIRYSFNLPRLAQQDPSFVDRFGIWLQFINNFSASAIEELAKYLVAVICLAESRHVRKLSDMVVFMIFIGLGFSLVEDAIFFLDPQTDAPYRLLSFYVHSGTSAIMGYSLGRFKFHLTGYGELFRAVLGAMALHFAYNAAASLQDPPYAFYLTVMITIYISLQIFILFRRAISEEYVLEVRAKPASPTSRLLNLTKEKSPA